MTATSNRRRAMEVVGASAAPTGFVVARSEQATVEEGLAFGMARRDARGQMQSAPRIIAADDLKPVVERKLLPNAVPNRGPRDRMT